MGMYNEVWATCPECGFGQCYMQISQVVLGFGDFRLDNMSTLEGLTDDEIRTLKRYVLEDDFHCSASSVHFDEEFCEKNGCGHVFNPLKKQVSKKVRAHDILFGEED